MLGCSFVPHGDLELLGLSGPASASEVARMTDTTVSDLEMNFEIKC